MREIIWLGNQLGQHSHREPKQLHPTPCTNAEVILEQVNTSYMVVQRTLHCPCAVFEAQGHITLKALIDFL